MTEKQQAGRTLRTIPREVYNATIDLIEQARNRSLSIQGNVPIDSWNSTIVKVRNNSGATVVRGGILEVTFDASPIDGSENADEYRRQPVLDGDTPSGDSALTPVVTLEPILDGAIGKAVISGIAVALVDLQDEEDTRCKAAATGYLTSDPNGPIGIVHLCELAEDEEHHLAYVFLPGPPGVEVEVVTNVCPVYEEIEVDLTITSVSGGTWS